MSPQPRKVTGNEDAAPSMTKVLVRFPLQARLEEPQLARLADLRGVYGVLGFDLDEGANSLAVEYDATRLKVEEVAALLRRAGIPALRQ